MHVLHQPLLLCECDVKDEERQSGSRDHHAGCRPQILRAWRLNGVSLAAETTDTNISNDTYYNLLPYDVKACRIEAPEVEECHPVHLASNRTHNPRRG